MSKFDEKGYKHIGMYLIRVAITSFSLLTYEKLLL